MIMGWQYGKQHVPFRFWERKADISGRSRGREAIGWPYPAINGLD